MGPHATWFDFIPGMEGFKASLQPVLGRTWTWQAFQATHFEISHVIIAVLVVLLISLGARSYAASVRGTGDDVLLPPRQLGTRAVFEGLADAVFDVLEGVMGPKNARKFLPFLGTFFV